MAIERNYFITMYHQAGLHFENFPEVKFLDILLPGTGHRDRRLNRDSPGQIGTLEVAGVTFSDPNSIPVPNF